MNYYFLNNQLNFQSLKTKNQLEGEKTEILVQNLYDGIILLDLDLNVNYISKQASILLNLHLRKTYQKNFLSNFDKRVGNLILLKLESLFQDKKKLYFNSCKKIILQSKSDFNRTILLIIKIAFKKDRIVGLVVIIRDISKEIEINKKKVSFLSNLSHELRTPIFNIQSFIQTLDQHSNELEQKEIKEFLGITNKEILRLTRLVNTILDFSKFNFKNLYLFSEIDINDIFDQLIQVYSIRFRQKKIKVKKEIEPDLPFILGRKDLLLQVFDNLLGNALKFSSYRGTILCRIYKVSNNSKTKIRIEIGDGGLGIPEKDQKNIFKRFSRVNDNTRLVYGVGLGLSIVRIILKNHGSKICFTSNMNEGTIFFIDFASTKKLDEKKLSLYLFKS